MTTPKHRATVVYVPVGLYRATCTVCGDLPVLYGSHSAAMVASLDHRSEYK